MLVDWSGLVVEAYNLSFGSKPTMFWIQHKCVVQSLLKVRVTDKDAMLLGNVLTITELLPSKRLQITVLSSVCFF